MSEGLFAHLGARRHAGRVAVKEVLTMCQVFVSLDWHFSKLPSLYGDCPPSSPGLEYCHSRPLTRDAAVWERIGSKHWKPTAWPKSPANSAWYDISLTLFLVQLHRRRSIHIRSLKKWSMQLQQWSIVQSKSRHSLQLLSLPSKSEIRRSMVWEN